MELCLITYVWNWLQNALELFGNSVGTVLGVELRFACNCWAACLKLLWKVFETDLERRWSLLGTYL